MRIPSIPPIAAALTGLVVATVTLVGCSPAPEAAAVVERDSSGVRIIESEQSSWELGGGWQVGSEPLVRIGSVDGPQGTLLFHVGDVALLSNGRIVATNGGNHELVTYSAGGSFIRHIGREGNGPGELVSPTRLWVLPGDSLAVLSFGRLTVFDSAGSYVRSIPLPGWSPHDWFDDGTMLWLVIPPGEDTFAPGAFQPRYALVRTETDGSGADTLHYVSGDQMYRLDRNGAASSWYAPFGTKRVAAAHESSIYTGNGESFEIHEIDSQGNLVRIIRRRASALQVSQAAIDSFEAQMLASARTDAARQTRLVLFREWKYPSHRPMYDDIHVDKEGNIWVRHSAIAHTSAEWSVFDSPGVWLGTVRLPAHLEVKEIGSSYILGVTTDSLGVEYIEMYGLEKRSS